jgi:hypothetical protein
VSSTWTWLDQREAEEPAKVAAALANYAKRRDTLRAAAHDNGDDRFGLWLAMVDMRVQRRVGLGLFDLGDWPMYDAYAAYAAGASPKDAAEQALASDDIYAMFMTDCERRHPDV